MQRVASSGRDPGSQHFLLSGLRAITSNIVTKEKELVTLKVEQLRGSHPSSLGGKEKPSKSVKKESWYKMTMHDSQEHDRREVFKDGSEQDGRDNFLFRETNQLGGLERIHGIIFGSEDRSTFEWCK
jgi:hypothetical protein